MANNIFSQPTEINSTLTVGGNNNLITTGQIGIGTTSPAEKLHVVGTSIKVDAPGSTYARVDIGSQNNRYFLQVEDNTFDGIGFYKQTPATSGFQMVINTDGNVGIGTTSPDSILDISSATPIFTLNATATADAQGIVFKQSNTFDASIKHTPASGEFNFTVGRNSTWGGDFKFVADTYDTYLMGRNFHRFNILGSEAMRISDASNVGIGTTSPLSRLHVSADGSVAKLARSTAQYFDFNMDAANSNLDFYVGSNGKNVNLTIKGSHNGAMTFGTQDTERMRITSAGNVGIGTTSPILNGVLTVVQQNSAGLGSTDLTLNHYYAGTKYIDFGWYDSSIGNISNDGGTRISINSSNGLLLNPSSGNVGIGTTSPTTKLYVDSGESTFNRGNSDGAIARFRGKNNEKAVIGTVDSWFASNVGIGTTSPDSKLHISDTLGNAVIRLERNDNAIVVGDTYGSIEFEGQDANTGASGIRGSIHGEAEASLGQMALVFSTAAASVANAEKMRITSAGNVGIGTTNPTSKLEVVGNVRAGDGNADNFFSAFYSDGSNTLYRGYGVEFNRSAAYLRPTSDKNKTLNIGNDSRTWDTLNFNASRYYFNEDGTNHLTILSGGNVGIGTTNPTSKLQVQGSFKVSNQGVFESYIDVASTIFHRENIRVLNKAGTNWVTWATRDTSGAESKIIFTNVGGNISQFTNDAGYLTAESDTLDSVTDRGATTTNAITVGDITSTGTQSIFFGSNGGTTPTIQRRIVLNGASDGSETLGIQYRGFGTQNTRLSVFLDPVNKQFIHNDTWSTGGGVDEYKWQRTGSDKFTLNTANGNLIVHSGNVGIGTTSPTEKLDVSGNARIVGNLKVEGTVGVTNIVTNRVVKFNGSIFDDSSIYDNGNVGIGTTSPATKLVVSNNGSGGFEVNPIGGDNGNSPYIQSFNRSTSAVSPLGYYASAHYLMSGNVGISTSNPAQSKLVIAPTSLSGDANLSGMSLAYHPDGAANRVRAELKIENFSGAFELTDSGDITTTRISALGNSYLNGGNIGIGTASPSYKLQISEPDYARISLHQTTTGGIWQWGNDGSNMYAYYSNTGVRALDITNNGNVGIGTTSPSQKLEVSGHIYANNGTNSNVYLETTDNWIYGDVNGVGIFNANNNLRLYTGGNERFRITSAGNVGIGTTSPTEKLHVDGTAKITGDTTLGTTSSAFLQMLRAGANYIAASNASGELRFRTGGSSDRLTITNTGNIGIGTTSPNSWAQLETTGTVAVGGILYIKSSQKIQGLTGFPGGAGNLSINPDGGNVGIGTTSPNNKLDVRRSNSGIVAEFHSTAGTPDEYVDVKLISGNTTAGTYGTILRHQRVGTSGADFTILTNPALTGTPVERFRITKDGEVGIGTDNPTGLFNSYISAARQITHNGNGGDLSVISDNSSAPVFYVKGTGTADLVNVFDNTTEVFTIKDGGNVGINTDSPNVRLEIKGNTAENTQLRLQTAGGATEIPTILFRRNSAAYGDIQYRPGGGGDQGIHITDYRADASNIIFKTAGSNERMRITHNGNLGIGTTSPNEKLHVESNGDGHIAEFKGSGTNAGGRNIRIGVGNTDLSELPTYQPYIYASASDSANNSLAIVSEGGSSSTGGIDFYTGTNSAGTTKRMRIDRGGNVGIGTTSPSDKLTVIGNIDLPNTNNWTYLKNSATQGGIRISTGNNSGTLTNGLSVSSAGNYVQAHHPLKALDGFSVTGNSTVSGDLTVAGNVGIGFTSPITKLDVNGSARAGGKITYTKSYSGGLDTTGVAVAGLISSYNGASARFVFEMHGGTGGYQRVVYSCYNAGGVWYAKNVINEGTNHMDVVASANASTITFTFKSLSGTLAYTPFITVEQTGVAIDTQYL